jgi:hypothetical protein
MEWLQTETRNPVLQRQRLKFESPGARSSKYWDCPHALKKIKMVRTYIDSCSLDQLIKMKHLHMYLLDQVLPDLLFGDEMRDLANGSLNSELDPVLQFAQVKSPKPIELQLH